MGEGEATARAAAPRGLAVAGAVGILVIALAFLAGRRRGRAARPWSRSGGSRPWTCSSGASCGRASAAGWPANWYWFLLAGATFVLRRVLNDRGGAVSTVQGRTG